MGNYIETKENPRYDISFLNIGDLGVRIKIKVGSYKPEGIKVQLYKENELVLENTTGSGGLVYFTRIELGEYKIKIKANPNALLNNEEKLDLFKEDGESVFEEQVFDYVGSIVVRDSTFLQNFSIKLEAKTSLYFDVNDGFNDFIIGTNPKLKCRFILDLVNKDKKIQSESELREFVIKSEYSKEKNLKLINNISEINSYMQDFPICYLCLDEKNFDYVDNFGETIKDPKFLLASLSATFIFGSGGIIYAAKKIKDSLSNSLHFVEMLMDDLLNNDEFNSLDLRRSSVFHPSNYMLINKESEEGEINSILIGISKEINYDRNKYNFEYRDYVTRVEEIVSKEDIKRVFDEFELDNNKKKSLFMYKFNGQYFELLPQSQSVYHQGDYQNFGELDEEYNGNKNRKFVSFPDGRHEIVLTHNDRLVTDKNYYGTYNFYGPSNKLGHMVYDVLPYWLWGTFSEDNKTFPERIHGIINEYVGYTEELKEVKDFYNISIHIELALKLIFEPITQGIDDMIQEIKGSFEDMQNSLEGAKYNFMREGQKMIDYYIYKGVIR